MTTGVILGAIAYADKDDAGKNVTILRTPDQQIGLHEVQKEILQTFPNAGENNVKHHGARRQWLAPITMAALTSGNTEILNAIMQSSVNAEKAAEFSRAIVELAGESTIDAAVKKLTPDVLLAIQQDGTLDESSVLVQTLEKLGKHKTLSAPDTAIACKSVEDLPDKIPFQRVR